jgi:hypothetical protein
VLLVLAVLAAAAVAFATRGRGHANAAPAALHARKNTIARIDPSTNAVSAVIPVGPSPILAAADGGHSVWVYNLGGTISEVDAQTNRVRRTTATPSLPASLSRFAGPVLAADRSGAWFVSGLDNRPFLTRLVEGGQRKRLYRLDVTPTGVAEGGGAVWVVGQSAHGFRVLRIDPDTGRVTATTRFHDEVDSIAFGFGAVWVVDSARAWLYRMNPRTARRTGMLALGDSRAARPEVMTRGGYIWVRLNGVPGTTIWVDPSTMAIAREETGGSSYWGEDRGDLGGLWWYSWATGSLYRQEVADGRIRTINVTRSTPDANGPCLTSIAIGSGSLWLTAAPSPDGGLTCPPG